MEALIKALIGQCGGGWWMAVAGLVVVINSAFYLLLNGEKVTAGLMALWDLVFRKRRRDIIARYDKHRAIIRDRLPQIYAPPAARAEPSLDLDIHEDILCADMALFLPQVTNFKDVLIGLRECGLHQTTLCDTCAAAIGYANAKMARNPQIAKKLTPVSRDYHRFIFYRDYDSFHGAIATILAMKHDVGQCDEGYKVGRSEPSLYPYATLFQTLDPQIERIIGDGKAPDPIAAGEFLRKARTDAIQAGAWMRDKKYCRRLRLINGLATCTEEQCRLVPATPCQGTGP